jgi:rubrerythrin
MFEQAMLAEQFELLLADAEQAEKMYASLAGNTDDPAMRQQLDQVYRDKQRHVELTRRLLDLVN